ADADADFVDSVGPALADLVTSEDNVSRDYEQHVAAALEQFLVESAEADLLVAAANETGGRQQTLARAAHISAIAEAAADTNAATYLPPAALKAAGQGVPNHNWIGGEGGADQALPQSSTRASAPPMPAAPTAQKEIPPVPSPMSGVTPNSNEKISIPL